MLDDGYMNVHYTLFFLLLCVFGLLRNKLEKDSRHNLLVIRPINCQCWQQITTKCIMETKDNKFSGASFSIFGLDQFSLRNTEY